VDGITPIAVRPHTCTAAADIANDDFQTDIEGMTTWPTIVLADGYINLFNMVAFYI
jgi:hypothetical protein